MKRVQLFVHRHYETIKLAMLVILVMLCGFIVTAQIVENDTRSKNRTEAVAEVAQAVKSENEQQTDIINRQFRAICILIIETSGQAGLNKLDDESRSRCENLEATRVLESSKPEQAQRSQGTGQSSVQSSSSSSSDNTPSQSEAQSNTSQATPAPTPQPTPSQPGLVQRLNQGVEDLFNGVDELITNPLGLRR